MGAELEPPRCRLVLADFSGGEGVSEWACASDAQIGGSTEAAFEHLE